MNKILLAKLLDNTSTFLKLSEKYYGTSNDMEVVKSIQQFLVNTIGKHSLGNFGVDGKWGEKSKQALRTWLLYNGKQGDGSLNEDTLAELSKYIPKVKEHYTKIFGGKDPQLGF